MKYINKLCFICSSGGHFEQIKQLDKVMVKYDHYFVLPKNDSTVKFHEKKYLVGDFYRKKSIIFIIRFVITSLQQLCIFLKEMPDIVITTGAGVVIPTCLYAHIFNKKIIYIESFARMKSLNKTAKFLYKYSDKFIVQWPKLKNDYPDSIYGGWIY